MVCTLLIYVANESSAFCALSFSVFNADDNTTAVELVVDIDEETNVDNPDANTLVVDNAVVKERTDELIVEMERPTLTLLFKIAELKPFSTDIALEVSIDN